MIIIDTQRITTNAMEVPERTGINTEHPEVGKSSCSQWIYTKVNISRLGYILKMFNSHLTFMLEAVPLLSPTF